jgi:hypothetical protein
MPKEDANRGGKQKSAGDGRQRDRSGPSGEDRDLRATIRVTFWGALALGITAGIGKLFGTIL